MTDKGKILVIEEQDESRNTFRAVLEKEGYAVLDAQDGPSGLEQIKQGNPDLVLLDLLLPGLGGIDICKAVKSDPALLKIPILITTYNSHKDELIRCLEAGADDYVMKPFDENELLARIQTSLKAGTLLKQMEQEKKDLLSILEISNAITSTLDSRKVLYTIVKKISDLIEVSRCSIVRVDPNQDRGVVVSSSEDPDISNLPIDLGKYPEILKVLNTKEIVAINDIQTDPTIAPVREILESINVQALLVLPVIMKKNLIGTILLRTARRERPFEEREIQFCQIITNAAANALLNAALFENLEMANLDLERLATTDGLTGIYNHRHFYTRLDEEFTRFSRYDTPLSLIMFDIDNFKEINDRHGHRHGDSVLREFAEILKICSRKSDIIARYGGDEFVLILPQTKNCGAEAEARRVLEGVSNHPFKSVADLEVLVSYGIASCPDGEIHSADDLIARADRNLYSMKKAHKAGEVTSSG